MNNHRIEFRIGVVVLVALATLVVLVIWFGKHTIVNFGEEYTLRFRFETTPGVKVNTPVVKNGIQIGRVSNIALVDQDREVEVTIRLPKERKVYTDEECRVRQRMIMGDSTLEIVKKKKFTGKVEPLSPNSPPQPGASPLDLVGGFANLEGDLQKAIASVSHTAETMSLFIDRINAFLGSPEEMLQQQADIRTTVREMTDTMRALRSLSDGAGILFNDPTFQSNAKKIAQELPDLFEMSRGLLADSDVFLKQLRASVERGTATLDKVDGFLDGFRSEGTEAMREIQMAAKKINSLVSDVGSILGKLGESDTPLLQRVLQPEVADNLMATIENVRSITEQFDLLLRNDVRPITHNMKIFTDKIARDPSVFIRNLVRKQPPIKNGIPIWDDDFDDEDFGLFHEEVDEPIYEPVSLRRPPAPCVRQRSVSFPGRIAAFFSPPKPVAVQPPMRCQARPIPDEVEFLEPIIDEADEEPLTLYLPRRDPVELPQNDGISVVGPITTIEQSQPYRQISYLPEPTGKPRLVFSQ